MGDGAHIGARADLAEAAAVAAAIGCTAYQLVLGNQRAYLRTRPLPESEAAAVRAAGMQLLIHAPYVCVLTNPPDDPRTARSLEALRLQLALANRLNAAGVVVHPGRMRGDADIAALAANLAALEERAGTTPLLLENAAAGLHARPAVLAEAIEHAGAARAGICIDTAHAHAAGHDLAAPGGVAALLGTAAPHVRAVHLNNSITPLGSGRDRHGALADGVLWPDQMRTVYRALRGALGLELPLVVEAESAAEVAILRDWRAELVREPFPFPDSD